MAESYGGGIHGKSPFFSFFSDIETYTLDTSHRIKSPPCHVLQKLIQLSSKVIYITPGFPSDTDEQEKRHPKIKSTGNAERSERVWDGRKVVLTIQENE